ERGELTEDLKQKIEKAREDAKQYGYALNSERYFFVEQFYETDFPKVSKGPSMGTRMFDLTEVLQMDSLPDTERIAELLRNKDWK
ncbi:MAG: hypothetical protein II047_13540, partial [Bacteroidales bacterium]|nr:hypothetical protein [Bacteroidales bacterium]